MASKSNAINGRAKGSSGIENGSNERDRGHGEVVER